MVYPKLWGAIEPDRPEAVIQMSLGRLRDSYAFMWIGVEWLVSLRQNAFRERGSAKAVMRLKDLA